MWRIVLPFVQFAVDCLLGLGAFALIAIVAIVVCGLWENANYRRNPRHESFMV